MHEHIPVSKCFPPIGTQVSVYINERCVSGKFLASNTLGILITINGTHLRFIPYTSISDLCWLKDE